MSLACTDVRALYGGFVAVDGVSLSVEGGHILGVAGPNGAGKTTLFDVLSGYHGIDGGRVELNGTDITRLPVHRRVRLGLARTFQSPIVPTDLTVGETLEAARIAWSPKVDRADVERLGSSHGSRPPTRFTAAGSTRSTAASFCSRACSCASRASCCSTSPARGMMQDEIDEMDAIIRQMTVETGIAVIVVEHRLELLHAVAETVARHGCGQGDRGRAAGDRVRGSRRSRRVLRRSAGRMTTVLEVRGLSAGYGPLRVLHEIDLAVAGRARRPRRPQRAREDDSHTLDHGPRRLAPRARSSSTGSRSCGHRRTGWLGRGSC